MELLETTYSGDWATRFVVLVLLYNKRIRMKVSTRHNDQYQAGMRMQIALLTMPL